MIENGACGTFAPDMLACFARNIDPICRAVYA